MMLDVDKDNPRGFDEPNDHARLHGEKYCGAAKDDVIGGSYPYHCMHRSGDDLVCCWCGDVFCGHDQFTEHGSNFHELTPREVQTATLMAQGLSNKLIAGQLGVSEHTAKFFVRCVTAKLGHTTRAGAAAEAVRRGIVR